MNVGDRFGRLVVVGESDAPRRHGARAFQCDCGRYCSYSAVLIQSGKRTECERCAIVRRESRRMAADAHRVAELALTDHLRAACRAATKRAIRAGELVRPDACQECRRAPRGDVHAHHEDYDKPLEIVWLCSLHHHWRHDDLRKAGKDPKTVHHERHVEAQRALRNVGIRESAA